MILPSVVKVGLCSLLFFVCALNLSAETIRVASYNVRNYLITNRWYDGAYRTEYPKPEEEKTALRAVICQASPDILALQEMGDIRYLKELQRDLKGDGLDYKYRVLMEAEDEVRHTAVLSKLPFEHVKLKDDLSFAYSGGRSSVLRGLSEITFKVGDLEWVLFNLHLKSRRSMKGGGDYNSVKFRTAEAQAIRDYIRKGYPADKSPYYLLLGDFNDVTKSSTMKRFYKVGGKSLMYDIQAYDSKGEQWTYHYKSNRSYEQVDYILVSPSMKACVQGLRAVIVGGNESRLASDHRMLYVDLELN